MFQFLPKTYITRLYIYYIAIIFGKKPNDLSGGVYVTVAIGVQRIQGIEDKMRLDLLAEIAKLFLSFCSSSC